MIIGSGSGAVFARGNPPPALNLSGTSGPGKYEPDSNLQKKFRSKKESEVAGFFVFTQ